ncbi:MAG: hypothetical protein AB3N16_07535 [Flavobacteriaceae bacterium]
MNKRELINGIKKEVGLSDFNAVHVGAGTVSLVRSKQGVREEIVFSYLKYPETYVLQPVISGWKTFDALEDILEKHFVKNKMAYTRVSIHCKSRRFQNMILNKIKMMEDIKMMEVELNTMIHKDVIPFFSDYETLTDVYANVKELGKDFVSINNFLFDPQPIRRIALAFINKDHLWKEEANRILNAFVEEKNNSGENIYAGYIKVLKDLIKDLSSHSSE